MKRGVITTVNVNRDDDKVLVDVNVGVGQDHTNIDFKMPAPGIFYIPEVGQHAIVYDEGDGKRAAMHPESTSDPPPLPDINEGEIAIVVGGSAKVTISSDGTVKLGDGGTFLLKDVTVETTKDTDGHVTSVSLNKTRSTVSETE